MVENMPNKIALLSQETIDKIAAGEVVERPSSVIKELTENSIDAGSTAITIEINDGGTSFIRVSDNGCGIRREDLSLAFLRHSTSKIRTSEDLNSISSLGFRGEALSSIAAISRLELFTKTEDEITGSHYVIEGSKEVLNEEIGTPNGTSILVHHMFYNTPARKKFLKSNQTEASYIEELVSHLALSHPEISFRFISNGKEKLYTTGNGNLLDVIYLIFGREIASNLLPINIEDELVSIHGFIGKPLIHRGNRNFENFYVNKRFIKSNLLSKSVEEGCIGFLMQHQFPFCVLFLEFDYGKVDVNVHPSKMEVRFESTDIISNLIREAVHNALSKREDIVEAEPVKEKKTTDISPVLASIPKTVKKAEPFEAKRLQEIKETITEAIHKDTPYERQYQEFYKEKEIPVKEDYVYEQTTFLSRESMAKFEIIGQVFDTYWIVEFDNKMYIIDQHAAHEKVLFEKTMKLLKEKEMTSQMVSPPIIISLSPNEKRLLNDNIEAFETLGYDISSFGGAEFSINAIPGNLYNLDPKDLFLNVIAELDGISSSDAPEIVLEKVASMSCKAAIKGNNHLSQEEINVLLKELLELDNPYHCPHGRPTIISMSKYELDKKFKRII